MTSLTNLLISFNEKEVISIANDLMIAATVTTSYTTLWTLYLFAMESDKQNPQTMDKIHKKLRINKFVA